MNQIEQLAAQIRRLEKEVRRGNTTPQLQSSSIEDGALGVNALDGTTMMQIGKQFDETSVAATLSGPVPPKPSAPIITPVPGGLSISWDGYFVDPATGLRDVQVVAPMDFKQVDVVALDDPNGDFIGTPPQQAIVSPRGGRAFISFPDTNARYVALIARSAAGKASAVSDLRAAQPLAEASGAASEAYNLALSALTAANEDVRTFYQAEPPWADGEIRPTSDLGALWVDADDPALPAYRWVNNTWTMIPDNAYGVIQAKLETMSSDTGWQNITGLARGETIGFPIEQVIFAQYRRKGGVLQVRVSISSNTDKDFSVGVSQNIANQYVLVLPSDLRPDLETMGSGRWDDAPITVVLTADGVVIVTGAPNRIYRAGTPIQADFVFID